jgi:hypothetical protein
VTTLAFWWILAALSYVILFVAIERYGKRGGAGLKFLFGTICVLILLVPFMHPPISYAAAVFIVLDLLVLCRGIFKSEPLSRPTDL